MQSRFREKVLLETRQDNASEQVELTLLNEGYYVSLISPLQTLVSYICPFENAAFWTNQGKAETNLSTIRPIPIVLMKIKGVNCQPTLPTSFPNRSTEHHQKEPSTIKHPAA
jgi:hypothetical protein